MQEIARACYLEDVMFGPKDSNQRFEISELIERTTRMTVNELIDFLNTHMASKLFICGIQISAADIVIFAHVASTFSQLGDLDKMEKAAVFRWIDHVQHLPGLLELVMSK